MILEDYVNKQTNDLEMFFDNYHNTANHNKKFTLFFTLILSLLICLATLYIDGFLFNSEYYFFYGVVSFIASFFVFCLTHNFQPLLIKNLGKPNSDGIWISYYKSNFKREIKKTYNSFSNIQKKALHESIFSDFNGLRAKYYFNKNTAKLAFLNKYIEQHISLNNYQNIIMFINKNFENEDSLKKASSYIFKHLKENTTTNHKDDIADFIFNSDLNKEFKKILLTDLKQHSKEKLDEEIKELYHSTKNIKFKQSVVQI